jgi:hypothetical protein
MKTTEPSHIRILETMHNIRSLKHRARANVIMKLYEKWPLLLLRVRLAERQEGRPVTANRQRPQPQADTDEEVDDDETEDEDDGDLHVQDFKGGRGPPPPPGGARKSSKRTTIKKVANNRSTSTRSTSGRA